MQQCGVYTIGYDDRIAVMNARLGVSNALGSQEGTVLDAETGDVVHRIQFVFHSAGRTYTNHAAARDVVFFGQYEKVSALPPPFYNWAVCSQGDRPRVLALNATPLTKAPPVFVGDRVYMRCKHEVICLGRGGAAGAAYERKRLAEHFLKVTVPPRPWPDEQPPVDVAPDAAPLPDGMPVWPVSVSTAPGRWLFAGPFPAGSKPLADPAAARLQPGQTLSAAAIQRQVVELDPKFIEAKQETKFWRGNMQYVEGTAIDFIGAVGKTPSSLAYYYTVLRATRPCVVRLAVRGGSNVESWLSGRHIIRDDGLYRLAAGHHPWLIAVTLRQVPPIPGVCIRPTLVQVPDHDRAMQVWREEVKALRPDLVRLAAEDPRSDAAAVAQRLLKQVDGTPP
jgi:hypothetical protein